MFCTCFITVYIVLHSVEDAGIIGQYPTVVWGVLLLEISALKPLHPGILCLSGLWNAMLASNSVLGDNLRRYRAESMLLTLDRRGFALLCQSSLILFKKGGLGPNWLAR